MQKNLSIIFANTKRSESYFNEIKKNKISVDNIFFYSTKKNKFLNEIIKYPFKKKIKIFCTNNINSVILVKSILGSKSNFILFSGYDAEIIKNKSLLKKKILHCHPGLIPKYKGSTVTYYSLIQDNYIYVSLINISKEIDGGKVFFTKKFKPPKKKHDLENKYDNYIRANTFISFLKTQKPVIKKQKNKYENYYYIAHPIIRNIIINPKLFLKKNYNLQL